MHCGTPSITTAAPVGEDVTSSAASGRGGAAPVSEGRNPAGALTDGDVPACGGTAASSGLSDAGLGTRLTAVAVPMANAVNAATPKPRRPLLPCSSVLGFGGDRRRVNSRNSSGPSWLDLRTG